MLEVLPELADQRIAAIIIIVRDIHYWNLK